MNCAIKKEIDIYADIAALLCLAFNQVGALERLLPGDANGNKRIVAGDRAGDDIHEVPDDIGNRL